MRYIHLLFFDELLHAMNSYTFACNHRDDKQARVSTAEIITAAFSCVREIVVAAEFFAGNQPATHDF